MGNHTITARATDSSSATAEAQVSVTVEAAAAVTEPEPEGISLKATGYKVKGVQKADLAWNGAASASIDVYRNGTRIVTVPNSHGYTDALNRKGAGSYSYVVCEAGTATCSAASVIVF